MVNCQACFSHKAQPAKKTLPANNGKKIRHVLKVAEKFEACISNWSEAFTNMGSMYRLNKANGLLPVHDSLDYVKERTNKINESRKKQKKGPCTEFSIASDLVKKASENSKIVNAYTAIKEKSKAIQYGKAKEFNCQMQAYY